MDRGAWWATVHGVTKSQTHTHTCTQKWSVFSKNKFKDIKVWAILTCV